NHTPLVLANPGQLGQVFLNLLLNAAHAIEAEDPLKNSIRVVTRTAPTGDILIEISDTGRGMSPEVRQRIFDPFFTTKPLGVGTGPGLSICHGIVRSLNGTITVESDVGRGTTFRILLPPSAEHISTPKPAPIPLPDLRGRILVVDDEPRLGEAVRDMIGVEHDTSVVTTGSEALRMLLREPDGRFDIILCDLHMPETSGMDVYEKLAVARPTLADRMVFMTGGAFTERSREFVSRVKNPCIDKPIDLRQLRQLVTTTLIRRQS